MDARDQIRRLLRDPRPETFAVLFDLLEESGWDPVLIGDAADMMPWTAEQMTATDSTSALARLLGELAKTDYPRAVRVLTSLEFGRNDYRSYGLIVDAINTAWFNRPEKSTYRQEPGATWETQLAQEEMEWITGETGGDMGPWENLIDDNDNPTRRPWVVDFAPEGIDLDTYEGSFKTVYDGNNDTTLRDSEGLWRRVREFQAGHEPECPYRGSDEGDLVLTEQTYHGEHPGKSCALCEEPIGEEHGNLYRGEFQGEVFQLDVMAGVTDVEIEERGRGGRYIWDVTFFAGDDEVTPPGFDDDYFETREAAGQAVREFIDQTSGIPPGMSNIRIHFFPLIPD